MKKILAFILVCTLALLTLAGCANPKKSFKKLEEHIISKGEVEGDSYTLVLGETHEDDGAYYFRIAEKKGNTITLTLDVTPDKLTFLYSFSLILTKGSHDTVRWTYTAASGDEMGGIITPKEYVKSAYKLSYLSSNIIDAVKIDSTAGLCQSLCNYLLLSLESDLSALELDAVDFGFKDFKK